MTREALLAIALHQCPSLPMPEVLGPIMVGIALHENHTLDPLAINHNANGTDDKGVAQVNTTNFGWTGLQDWRDPCQNLTAAAKVLFARFNGNPPPALKALYAAGVFSELQSLKPAAAAAQAITIPPTLICPQFDMWARRACEKINKELAQR